jgi:hypothetical protein
MNLKHTTVKIAIQAHETELSDPLLDEMVLMVPD